MCRTIFDHGDQLFISFSLFHVSNFQPPPLRNCIVQLPLNCLKALDRSRLLGSKAICKVTHRNLLNLYHNLTLHYSCISEHSNALYFSKINLLIGGHQRGEPFPCTLVPALLRMMSAGESIAAELRVVAVLGVFG